MAFTLHDYQEAAVDHAVAELTAGRRAVIVSPTGSGKSFMQTALLKRLPGLVQTVPTLEIGLGILTKLTGSDDVKFFSEAKQRKALEAAGIRTVKEYHNDLMAGICPPPRYLAHDEGHHSVDATHTMVRAAAGNPPAAVFTATWYRGTPEETQKLRAEWGDPYVALTIRDAVKRGVIALPDFRVWPLINDELIDVNKGEFVVRQVESALTEDVLTDLVNRLEAEFWDAESGLWKRPITIRCPGVASTQAVHDRIVERGLTAGVVIGKTTGAERQRIFAGAVARETALVQVKVVGEGVDLPLRVLIDLAPTISPVAWMQAVGRITRPTKGEAPVYIATNHNLCRHAYLWEGMIPYSQIRDAQKAWGPDFKPSRRMMARALGLEGFGKFTVSPVPMVDGTVGSLYSLQTKNGLHQYAVWLHPCCAEPWYFERANGLTGKTLSFEKGGHKIEYPEKKYGKWRRIKQIPNADGYVSVKPWPMTEAMKDDWEARAESKGLDPKHVPTGRDFVILPILSNTGVRYKPED